MFASSPKAPHGKTFEIRLPEEAQKVIEAKEKKHNIDKILTSSSDEEDEQSPPQEQQQHHLQEEEECDNEKQSDDEPADIFDWGHNGEALNDINSWNVDNGQYDVDEGEISAETEIELFENVF